MFDLIFSRSSLLSLTALPVRDGSFDLRNSTSTGSSWTRL